MTAYVRFANALAWHALEVARGFHRQGHEVLLFCQRGSPLAVWAARESFGSNDTFNLNQVWPQDMLRGLAAVRRALREFRPDILNPHCPPGHSFLAMARRLEKEAGMLLIRTVADPRPPKRNPLNTRLHLKHTDRFIFTSTEMRRRYASVFPQIYETSRVILPGFRADDFVGSTVRGKWRQKLSLSEDTCLVGIVARMSPEKGQEIFLNALALLSEAERRKIVCVMAGEDSRERGRADLLAMAKRLGVETHVNFPGKLSGVQSLVADLDIGLITSVRSEAVCRVALEYMAFGVPVIAADTNILPDIVKPGENGWVYPAQDAAALAVCLREALLHPDERRRRGRNGYDVVRAQLSLERELQETMSVFKNARSRVRIP
jgi:glycosyltransferase involved in cell wall biosynthesis